MQDTTVIPLVTTPELTRTADPLQLSHDGKKGTVLQLHPDHVAGWLISITRKDTGFHVQTPWLTSGTVEVELSALLDAGNNDTLVTGPFAGTRGVVTVLRLEFAATPESGLEGLLLSLSGVWSTWQAWFKHWSSDGVVSLSFKCRRFYTANCTDVLMRASNWLKLRRMPGVIGGLSLASSFFDLVELLNHPAKPFSEARMGFSDGNVRRLIGMTVKEFAMEMATT